MWLSPESVESSHRLKSVSEEPQKKLRVNQLYQPLLIYSRSKALVHFALGVTMFTIAPFFPALVHIVLQCTGALFDMSAQCTEGLVCLLIKLVPN